MLGAVMTIESQAIQAAIPIAMRDERARWAKSINTTTFSWRTTWACDGKSAEAFV